MTENNPYPVELSIIVPILNEVDNILEFIEKLPGRQQLDYELLFVDGGSTDGTLEALPGQSGVRIINSARGRGRQLNAGIAAARGEWLLFLHVDSYLTDPAALRDGIDVLAGFKKRSVAGHFSLTFDRSTANSPAAYDFYERKARTSRPETIHGDQGFLVHRSLQQQVGCFREDLPAMEDTDFAERLRRVGQWRLLPAEIRTSARRFEAEGLRQRQMLGALMMCFREIGWKEFFVRAPELYRLQAGTGVLKLTPFLNLIVALLAAMPLQERRQLWFSAGSYVRRHGWQLFFACDGFIARRRGASTAHTPVVMQFWCEPLYEMITDNFAGRRVAAIGLRIWFAAVRAYVLRQERETVA